MQPDLLTMDDFDTNITYAGEWASSPNGFEQFYFMETMQCVFVASSVLTSFELIANPQSDQDSRGYRDDQVPGQFHRIIWSHLKKPWTVLSGD